MNFYQRQMSCDQHNSHVKMKLRGQCRTGSGTNFSQSLAAHKARFWPLWLSINPQFRSIPGFRIAAPVRQSTPMSKLKDCSFWFGQVCGPDWKLWLSVAVSSRLQDMRVVFSRIKTEAKINQAISSFTRPSTLSYLHLSTSWKFWPCVAETNASFSMASRPADSAPRKYHVLFYG